MKIPKIIIAIGNYFKKLHSPKTYTEFIHRARKAGINKIDIIVDDYGDKKTGIEHYCFIDLVAGNLRYNLKHVTYRTSVIFMAEKIMKDNLEEALGIAANVSHMHNSEGDLPDFEITINGKSPEEARIAAEEYRQMVDNRKGYQV